MAALTDRLLDAVRRALAQRDWKGLRPSHLRLLGFVPPQGVTATELAPVLRMTQQAAGQFVTFLERAGYLQVEVDAIDRRRRVVTRTAQGDAAVTAVDAHLANLEDSWSKQVGVERYRIFREVLREVSDS